MTETIGDTCPLQPFWQLLHVMHVLLEKTLDMPRHGEVSFTGRPREHWGLEGVPCHFYVFIIRLLSQPSCLSQVQAETLAIYNLVCSIQ